MPLQERFRADPQGVADDLPVRAALRHPRGAGRRRASGPGAGSGTSASTARAPLPLNFLLPPRLPAGAKVVIFPGGLLPPHAIAGHWGRRYRPASRLDHLKGLFAPDRPEPPLRYLRHYLRPSDWVRDAWSED